MRRCSAQPRPPPFYPAQPIRSVCIASALDKAYHHLFCSRQPQSREPHHGPSRFTNQPHPLHPRRYSGKINDRCLPVESKCLSPIKAYRIGSLAVLSITIHESAGRLQSMYQLAGWDWRPRSRLGFDALCNKTKPLAQSSRKHHWAEKKLRRSRLKPAVTVGTLFTMATPDYTCVPWMYQKDRATSNNWVSLSQNQESTPPEGFGRRRLGMGSGTHISNPTHHTDIPVSILNLFRGRALHEAALNRHKPDNTHQDKSLCQHRLMPPPRCL